MTKNVGYLWEDIAHVELERSVSAGIKWGTLGTDMVPLFEEHIARMERNITLSQWFTMEPLERALIIATRRIDIAVKNHQTEAEIKNAERKANMRKRK